MPVFLLPWNGERGPIVSQRSQYKRLLYAMCAVVWLALPFPEDDDDDDTKFAFKWIAAPNEMKNSTRHWSKRSTPQAQSEDYRLPSVECNRQQAATCHLPHAVCLSVCPSSFGKRQLTSQTTNWRPSSVLDLCQAALLAAIACCMPLAFAARSCKRDAISLGLLPFREVGGMRDATILALGNIYIYIYIFFFRFIVF